ncbi:MAG TPA: hypothetical protein VK624_21145 [Steroidobacteraceae bacterium]|nr:hypothetical protein [Steroidobacteraceae bacterium]
MNKLFCLGAMLLGGAALAQTPAPRDTMEPGVNTSAPVPQAAAPAQTVPDQTKVPASAAKPATTANKPAAKPGAAAPKGNAKDRLDLDASQITGNRELPKVLYIVPWRSAELGDLVGRPVNSLLDEVLEPVDRDVFRRQNRYFEALQPNEAAPASKPEK